MAMADTRPRIVPRSGVRKVGDSFINFLTNLGMIGKDKRASQQYTFTQLTLEQINAAFRGDWIVRKCVLIPPQDATREWRSWQAEDDDIELLEECERKHAIRIKMQQTLVMARLYGGAALVLGVDDNKDQMQPLDLERVRQDSLKFIHPVPSYSLSTGPLIRNMMSEWYGQPEYYEVRNDDIDKGQMDQVRMHPSRLIKFVGNEIADPFVSGQIWGDSILQTIDDAVRDAGLVTGSIANMIAEAKLDIIKIPDLTNIASTTEGQASLTERFTYANINKSVINALVLDTNEEWQRIPISFGGMSDVLQMYLNIASAASDIPITRFLGRSPAGMNATGDSDIRNHYDRIKSDQQTVFQPALSPLDEVLIRSALGDRPEEIYYEWNPLWQMSDQEKAALALTKAQEFKIDADEALIPDQALAEARINQLIEDGTYPGLDKAMQDAEARGEGLEEHLAEPTPEEIAQNALAAQGVPPGQKPPPVAANANKAVKPPGATAKRVAGAKDTGDPFARHLRQLRNKRGQFKVGQMRSLNEIMEKHLGAMRKNMEEHITRISELDEDDEDDQQLDLGLDDGSDEDESAT